MARSCAARIPSSSCATYLERRAEESESVRRVLARLKQEKLLDDSRYALDFARARATSRRQGARRIVQELRKRGVPDRSIDDAIAQVFADSTKPPSCAR